MSDYDDEGGEAPCWAHMFQEELMGERDDSADESDNNVENGPEAEG